MIIEHGILTLACFVNFYMLFLFFITNRSDIKYLKQDIKRLQKENRDSYRSTLKCEYNEADIKRIREEIRDLRNK